MGRKEADEETRAGKIKLIIIEFIVNVSIELVLMCSSMENISV